MKRQLRRNAKAKKKALSLKLYGTVKHADNMKRCSCAACGNARRFEKGVRAYTLQERKAKD